MALNFNDAITRLSQQKQAVSGRSPSRNEVAGVAEGLAAGASERLTRSKQLSIDEQRLSIQKELDEKRLAQEKNAFEAELQMGHEATLRDIKERRRQTGQQIGAIGGAAAGYAAGAAVGSAAGVAMASGTSIGAMATAGAEAGASFGPWGMAAGAVIGGVIGTIAGGSSWLCTEAEESTRFSTEEEETLKEFRKYAVKNHPATLRFYLTVGPALVQAINDSGNDSFFVDLKKNMIDKVMSKTDSGENEQAYEIYRKSVIELIDKYLPEFAEQAHELEAA